MPAPKRVEPDAKITGTFKHEFAFPTVITKMQWDNVDELNEQLEADLYKERVRDPVGIYKSNTAGTWHSDSELLKKSPAFDQLGHMFREAFGNQAVQTGVKPYSTVTWNLNAWGMMYADRGYATVHNHPNCHLAGVYYVSGADDNSPEKVMATGIKVKSGNLEFVNPVSHSLNSPMINLQPSYIVQPKAGLMCIFPAWLNHFVHPVDGDTMRCAIACNATILKVEEAKEPSDVSDK